VGDSASRDRRDPDARCVFFVADEIQRSRMRSDPRHGFQIVPAHEGPAPELTALPRPERARKDNEETDPKAHPRRPPSSNELEDGLEQKRNAERQRDHEEDPSGVGDRHAPDWEHSKDDTRGPDRSCRPHASRA